MTSLACSCQVSSIGFCHKFALVPSLGIFPHFLLNVNGHLVQPQVGHTDMSVQVVMLITKWIIMDGRITIILRVHVNIILVLLVWVYPACSLLVLCWGQTLMI